MRVVLFANNWLGWQVVRWLREQGADVAGLVRHPADRSTYREELLAAAGLPPECVFDGSRLTQPAVQEALAGLGAALGVSVLFDDKIPAPLLAQFPAGVVNLHPSLLPYNRGQYPNVWSLVDGTPSGVSLHYLDDGIDTGDVIAEREVPVEPIDTGETLYRKLERAALALFQDTWPSLQAGRVTRHAQDRRAGTSHRHRDVEAIDAIDPQRLYRAGDLLNILRARTFPPHRGAYWVQDGRRVGLRLQLAYEEPARTEPPAPARARPVRVLITAAGGPGTVEMLRTLRRLGGYEIVATDAEARATGFAYADRRHVVPLVTDASFAGAMRDLLREEQPDFIVPLIDEEIPVWHGLLQEPGAAGARLLAPSPAFCGLALDKWEATMALRRAGIPAPAGWLASEADAATFPAVIKPRGGRGGRGAAVVRDAEELRAYLAVAAQPADRYVVQERIEGTEYTVSVIVALGGPVLAVVPKEVVVKRGITQIGITRAVPAIEAAARQVQERLRADGPFNLQLILRPDGSPVIFEINPRYSTTTALTIAAGIHEVDAVIRTARGEPVGPLSFRPGLVMVRETAHTYVPEDVWRGRQTSSRCAPQLAGAGTGTTND